MWLNQANIVFFIDPFSIQLNAYSHTIFDIRTINCTCRRIRHPHRGFIWMAFFAFHCLLPFGSVPWSWPLIPLPIDLVRSSIFARQCQNAFSPISGSTLGHPIQPLNCTHDFRWAVSFIALNRFIRTQLSYILPWVPVFVSPYLYVYKRVDLGDMNANWNLLRIANSASTHRLFSAPIPVPLQHRALAKFGCTVARVLML